MPHLFKRKWPKLYGFEIYGNGPCYVVSVDRGSVAYNSGLLPGDQILELDGQDVSNSDFAKLKAIAKQSRSQPPTLGVVSRLYSIELDAGSTSKFGYTFKKGTPLVVDRVEYMGVAHQAGLRPGDVIVEMNGNPVQSAERLGTLSRQRTPSHQTLTLIPIGKGDFRTWGELDGPSPQGRREKANDLYDKMSSVLGDDTHKKMAMVGALKRYAQDRDIAVMCQALTGILSKQKHQKLLQDVRMFIPVYHRNQFDYLINRAIVDTPSDDSGQFSGHEQDDHRKKAQHSGQHKSTQIQRNKGHFGFILRGDNPVHVESVDPGGPADRAGIRQGDLIIGVNGIDVKLSSHGQLVRVLRDSGDYPTVEIIRPSTQGAEVAWNSASSTSSHDSTDQRKANHKTHQNSRKTYNDKVSYLLTQHEIEALTSATEQYRESRDVCPFYHAVHKLLDNPSKKTLWPYVMSQMTATDQDYCKQKLNITQKAGAATPRSRSQNSTLKRRANLPLDLPEAKLADQSEMVAPGTSLASQQDRHGKGTSFSSPPLSEQFNYLLTSRERAHLKRTLQHYATTRNINRLVSEMEKILDTPSKHSLWTSLIPQLADEHQILVYEKLNQHNLSNSQTMSFPADTYIGGTDSQSEHEQHVHDGDDFSISEAEFALQDIEHLQVSNDDDDDDDDDSEDRLEVSSVDDYLSDCGSPIKSTYVTEASTQPRTVDRKLDGEEQSSTLGMAMVEELREARRVIEQAKNVIANSSKVSETNHSSYPTSSNAGNQSSNGHMYRPTYGGNLHTTEHTHPEASWESAETFHYRGSFRNAGSDTERDTGGKCYSYNSNDHEPDKIGEQTISALQQLDAAVGDTTGHLKSHGQYNGKCHIPADIHINSIGGDTDGNNIAFHETNTGRFMKNPKRNLQSDLSSVKRSPSRQKNDLDIPPRPSTPAPTPPLPPPPMPHPVVVKREINPGKMSIKRLNWEKLKPDRIDETVWGQLGDTQELSEIVSYLELDHRFSTKIPTIGIGGNNRSREVYILNPRKAYNISILLGHLKLSVPEMKDALYLLDEDILTPELLVQLIAYAPDKNELQQYDTYVRDMEDLSPPDQFIYEMSRVPGYEERLKALLFKANFSEKVTEIRQSLQFIKKASMELRTSKKLGKILEMILAMGNYMNKGHNRIGDAPAFRIGFLTQMDTTKTSDNKSTFLHVLADAVYAKFPDAVSLRQDINTVSEAAKVSNLTLNEELQSLRRSLEEISCTVCKLSIHVAGHGINDKFQETIGHFISEASDEIQHLFHQNSDTMDEFSKLVSYFGEDVRTMNTTELFGVFTDFMTKFEKAHHHNLMYKRH